MTGRVRALPETPSEPHLEAAYALRDLRAVVDAFLRSRHGGWLSIARSLGEALGRPVPIEPTCRPEVIPSHLAPATVFLLAATTGEPAGCIGHVSARPANWTVGAAGAGESTSKIIGGSEVVEKVVDAVVDSVRTLSPDAVRPEAEVVIPFKGEGDSHALAVAVAAMHALLRAAVPRGLAATGGFDLERRRFEPVPLATLPSKIAAATRWGVRTLVVVEGQPMPDDLPEGLAVVRISSDPGALPLLVLQLASADRNGAAVIDAWRQALALYDLRVATRLNEPLESVITVTGMFVDPVARSLEAARSLESGRSLEPGRSPSASEVRAATAESGLDPIIVGLASDIRSRAFLHAGRTLESAWWDAIAIGLRGLGDLPDGMLGDHIMFRQPSHRSIVALDLGDLDDPPSDPVGSHESADPGIESAPDLAPDLAPDVAPDFGIHPGTDGGGSRHPHAVLDAAIEDLEGRWCTRHQALFAIFASNSRWRRRLYLARRDLDSGRLADAEHDLMRWRPRWEDLLDAHARQGLGMGNTDLPRQWNCVLEHAITEAALRDPVGFARGEGDGGIRREIAARWGRDDGLRADIEARWSRIATLSSFDLRGLLQWVWLSGEMSTPEPVPTSGSGRCPLPSELSARCRMVVGASSDSSSDSASIGVAEWWWRLLEPADADRLVVHAALRRSLDGHLSGEADGDGRSSPPGVHRLIALRRAAVLDLDRVSGSPGRDWTASIVAPDRPASLVRTFEELRSRPEQLLVRTPY